MKVLRKNLPLPGHFPEGTVVTLGNFDGIHLGHSSLLQSTVGRANEMGLTSVVITYHPNPALVLGKNPDFRYLTTIEDKLSLIHKYGVDVVLLLEFDQKLADMSAEEFLDEILIRSLHAKDIVIGFNHCFGKGRRGNYELLKQYAKEKNFRVDYMPPVLHGGEKVSSSLIRKFLTEGNILLANQFLGRRFSITGTVVKGFQRGREIGYPTANLDISSEIQLPQLGVYSGYLNVDGTYHPAMINLGRNPTFGENPVRLEVHVLDYHGDLYGRTLHLEFSERIRDERKFSGIDDLKAQLKLDETKVRILLTEV